MIYNVNSMMIHTDRDGKRHNVGVHRAVIAATSESDARAKARLQAHVEGNKADITPSGQFVSRFM